MTFPVLPANGPSGYNLTNSLRFRNSASAYLNRTFSTPTNNKIWTWSAWVKRGSLVAASRNMLGAGTSGTNYFVFTFLSDQTLYFQNNASSGNQISAGTTAVFRDPSAWYHLVLTVDTTQATNSNGVRIWVNGVQQTLTFGTYTQNTNTIFNSSGVNVIGDYIVGGGGYFDGYMAEVNFIDGQALTPSSFGSTNAVTGVWQPAKYTGTYGTNGFYLPFTNTTSTTTLGNDFSGNGNNWTTNNISLTSGVTYDSMTDVPTLTSPTAANFAVMNPLDNGGLTITGANLDSSRATASWLSDRCTFGLSSSKWYWEFTATSVVDGSNGHMLGLMKSTANLGSYPGGDANGWGYFSSNGQKYTNGAAGVAYGSSWTNGDVIGVAFDADNGTLVFYKNNVSQGTAYTGLTSGPYFPALGLFGTVTGSFNFGQRPFAYTPPSGFVALNTFNLPNSTIPAGNKYMDATTYTGNGSTQSIANSGSMQPDWVWIKERPTASAHALYDVLRGNTQVLSSNSIAAEYLQSPTAGLASFNSAGFSVTYPNTGDYYVNRSGQTYIGWQWKANGAGVTNTAGSITSTVSANTTSGFSVVSFAYPAVASKTVGHGLGVAPSMVILKNRNTPAVAGLWFVYHVSAGATQYLTLESTSAAATNSTAWDNTAPTSSVFTLGSGLTSGNYGTNGIAYCFAPIAGFSAFGSYTGNGSTDGPFVYTGFRPKFVLLKESSAAGNNWQILDTSRSTSNVAADILQPNLSNAESAFGSGGIDFLSNGFKLRTSSVSINASSSTIIYACFAENPFRNALAR